MTAILMDDVGASEERNVEGVSDTLMRLADEARYFRSTDGGLHAQVAVQNRHEIFGLSSGGFREWLIESFRNARGEPPPGLAVARVLSALKARARLAGRGPAVNVRVGRSGEEDQNGAGIYIDLGDESGKAVKLTALGWAVVDRPPVEFRRPEGQLALPHPCRDGSIERLRPFVNLGEEDFQLLVAWMAAALLPEGPYPVLAIHGEQGSAKSTLARVIRQLIDPQTSALLAKPRSTCDLVITAADGWLLAFDNLSELPNWLSDSLCRLATGGGFAGRALFSSVERSVVNAQRPLILNGIDEFVRRDDLADRCVFLHLPPISAEARRAEMDYWRSFRAECPAIFGGLLDAIVGGLRVLHELELAALPRMADFARFGEAVGRGLKWPENMFLSIYKENRRAATAIALEDSAVAQALLDSASLGGLRQWTRTATDMLQELSGGRRRGRSSAQWPKTGRDLANELRRISPMLRARGITVEFHKTRDARMITINAVRCFDESIVTRKAD